MPLVLAVALSAWAAGAPALQREALPFAPTDADRFASKLSAIVKRSAATSHGREAAILRTVVTEPELNAYLKYRAQSQMPTGVVDPYIWVLGSGRLAGAATVDLDRVRTSRERGWLDPMQLLHGRLPVGATGVLQTANGVGRFELESARVSGIPVPRALLQELVTFYTRTEANPEGVSLDRPFALPAGIRRIDVETGRAVIVQ
ncbi:MAG: hypothetical protein AB1806_00690 [Acidobacteriota bacterium]